MHLYKDIMTQIWENHIFEAIHMIETTIKSEGYVMLIDELNNIRSEYDMMQKYMAEGVRDDARKQMYDKVWIRLVTLVNNMSVYKKRNECRFYTSQANRIDATDCTPQSIKNYLENYVASMTLATIDPSIDTKKLADDKQKYISTIFTHIVTSTQWKKETGMEYADIILSPTIDKNDKLVLISAISLATWQCFDFEKWACLTKIFDYTDNEDIGQRAMVGWVLALQDPEFKTDYIRDEVNRMLTSEFTRRELIQMQLSMYMCLKAKDDREKVDKELMGVIRNSDIKLQNGKIIEIEDDPLDDVLNPDKEEEKIEQLEKYNRRILKMHKEGTDVFFGGFAHMKRYAFFYDIVNWFMPFTMDHPGLRSIASKDDEKQKTMMNMTSIVPLCNSDKYSLILGLAGIIDTLPENMLEAMKGGEASPWGKELDASDPLWIRHYYLQDLYRFFNLFTEKSVFHNPLTMDIMANPLFFGLINPENTTMLLKGLYKLGMTDKASKVIIRGLPSLVNNTDFLRIAGRCCIKSMNYTLADQIYSIAVLHNPTDEELLKNKAYTSMMLHDNNNAYEMYKLLEKNHPDKVTYTIYKHWAALMAGNKDVSIDEIFKLEYETYETEDITQAHLAKKLLGYALLIKGREKEAIEVYHAAINMPCSSPEDKHELAMALLLNHDTKSALTLLTEYCRDKAQQFNKTTQEMAWEMYKGDTIKYRLCRNWNNIINDFRLLCDVISKKEA